MNRVTLTVNGAAVTAEIEPRLHLADFLREHRLLTGTHLGCEHGVCGACTLLIDGEPARGCIAFAAACQGAEITTIEGLAGDAITQSLAAAFKAEHALQCGFCMPGMLVSARAIVLSLPAADDDRVRLELAGNLCRCTGYNGIVRAIRRVLDQRAGAAPPERAMLSAIEFAPVVDWDEGPASVAPPTATPDRLTASATIRQPRSIVWQALLDPALIARCVPGATLTSADGLHLAGELVARLGPIETRFRGKGDISYDADGFSGTLNGSGTDPASRTRLSASASFVLLEVGPETSRIEIAIAYELRGPLAQFGRSAILQAFVGALTRIVADNLERTLRGEETVVSPKSLSGGRLMLAVLRGWFRQ